MRLWYCRVSPSGYNPQNLQCISCRETPECIFVVCRCQGIFEIRDVSLLIPYLIDSHNFVRKLAVNRYKELQLYR